MISIILPVYNATATLARAIDSILAQSYPCFELIAVDDGSTDGSGALLEQYAATDPRIKVFHKENGGANSARNVGLEHICGEYVTFCDADDYVDDDWLHVFADNLENNDVVIQGWKYVRQGKTEPIYYENPPTDPARAADMMSGMESFGFLWNKCIRTEIIQQNNIRFNESYRFLEDEEFVCHYWVYVKKMKFVLASAYNYQIPNFDQKYAAIDNYGLYTLLVDHAAQFIHHQDSVTMRKYTMGLFRNMMLSFQQHRYAEAQLRLKEFAEYGKMYRQYNKYMRWIRGWNWMMWYPIFSIKLR